MYIGYGTLVSFSCKNSASSLSASSRAFLLVPSNISLSSVINCSFSAAAYARRVSPSKVVSALGIGIEAYFERIIPNNSLKIDRSLDGSQFNKLTGYKSNSWSLLIKSMYEFNLLNK